MGYLWAETQQDVYEKTGVFGLFFFSSKSERNYHFVYPGGLNFYYHEKT